MLFIHRNHELDNVFGVPSARMLLQTAEVKLIQSFVGKNVGVVAPARPNICYSCLFASTHPLIQPDVHIFPVASWQMATTVKAITKSTCDLAQGGIRTL